MTSVCSGTAARVTWLIPLLNGMPYLQECLESIEAETGRGSPVLVWDNGSTDGSLELLREWIPARLPGLVHTGETRTVGGSLRALVEMAETDYCARIDADDLVMRGRINLQTGFLDRHPEVAVLGGQVIVIDQRGKPMTRKLPYALTHEEIIAGVLHGDRNPMGHTVVMFRRKAVLDSGNYRDIPNVEDLDLWMRVARTSRIANLPETVAAYRVHPASCTQEALRESRLQSKIDAVFLSAGPELFSVDGKELALYRRNRLPGLARWAKGLRVSTWDTAAGPLWRHPAVIEALLRRLHPADIRSLATFLCVGASPREFALRLGRFVALAARATASRLLRREHTS